MTLIGIGMSVVLKYGALLWLKLILISFEALMPPMDSAAMKTEIL